RGSQMRARVFAKLMAGFLAVIVVATVVLGYGITSSWERLLWSSAVAVLAAALIAALIAHVISQRLRRMVHFAEGMALGNFSVRLDESSYDEMGQLAAALDKTSALVAEGFLALENNRAQLERLLNSLQDPVIAVSAENRVQWINPAIQRLVPYGVRLGSPL